MSDDKKKKHDLNLSDFEFLSAGKLRKMEIRFNSNTSERIHARAGFVIDHKQDDTEVQVMVTGKDFPEAMAKIHHWYHDFYTNIKVFGKLVGREDEGKDKSDNMPF